jgi:hypothetical protein
LFILVQKNSLQDSRVQKIAASLAHILQNRIQLAGSSFARVEGASGVADADGGLELVGGDHISCKMISQCALCHIFASSSIIDVLAVNSQECQVLLSLLGCNILL